MTSDPRLGGWDLLLRAMGSHGKVGGRSNTGTMCRMGQRGEPRGQEKAEVTLQGEKMRAELRLGGLEKGG